MMKKVLMSLLSLLCLVGCGSSTKSIDSKTVKEMIDNKEDFILVDIREVDEYNEGHIPTAVLIPLGTIETDFEKKIPDKNKKIVIYCRSGNRTKQGYEKITNLGYTNVYDLGGIIDWPYDIEK